MCTPWSNLWNCLMQMETKRRKRKIDLSHHTLSWATTNWSVKEETLTSDWTCAIAAMKSHSLPENIRRNPWPFANRWKDKSMCGLGKHLENERGSRLLQTEDKIKWKWTLLCDDHPSHQVWQTSAMPGTVRHDWADHSFVPLTLCCVNEWVFSFPPSNPGKWLAFSCAFGWSICFGKQSVQHSVLQWHSSHEVLQAQTACWEVISAGFFFVWIRKDSMALHFLEDMLTCWHNPPAGWTRGGHMDNPPPHNFGFVVRSSSCGASVFRSTPVFKWDIACLTVHWNCCGKLKNVCELTLITLLKHHPECSPWLRWLILSLLVPPAEQQRIIMTSQTAILSLWRWKALTADVVWL